MMTISSQTDICPDIIIIIMATAYRPAKILVSFLLILVDRKWIWSEQRKAQNTSQMLSDNWEASSVL